MYNRSLLSYLPPMLREIKEYQAITEAEQPEIDAVFSAIFSAPDERSPQTASEIGISIWENLFDITPIPSDTLEDRRFKVRSIMRDDSKMNYSVMVEKLTALCGAGCFEVIYRPDEYYLEVRIALISKNVKTQVLEMLDEDIPANFLMLVDLLYIKYAQLQKLTYGEMSAYTCEQLRESSELMKQLGD